MASVRRLNGSLAGEGPVALVLPGAGYTVQAPLLYWPVLALTTAGWDVWAIDWHVDAKAAGPEDMQGFVESALAQAEVVLPSLPKLVLAKSLGTFALPYFEKRDVRAAWLTPILTDRAVADALTDASTGSHLAVGGSADPSWRPDLVGATSAQLVSVEGANHSLELTTTAWRTSAQAQLDIIDRTVAHLLGS